MISMPEENLSLMEIEAFLTASEIVRSEGYYSEKLDAR
jgi:hypothetical protein